MSRENENRRVRGFVLVRLAVVLTAMGLGVCAACSAHCGEVLLVKTFEGLTGGFLVCGVRGARKWDRLRQADGVASVRLMCLAKREVKTGFASGLLVGLLFVAIVLLSA
jgi:hypothetical protein